TMNTELATLNPFRAKTGWDYPWMEPLFMRLAELDTEHGKMIPAIGVSWKILDNNTDFMVKLRQDIKFSNGDPVTAEDIKFSYEQYKDRKNAHVGRRIFKYITDVEIKDPTTLIFRMNKPYWNWSGLIRGACFIVPKKYYEAVGPKEFAKKPIGSGAFTLVKRMIGEGATYKVVANHPIYKPQFKTLKFKLVPDATVRVQLLKAGQADLIWGVPPQDYASLKKTKGIKIYSLPYPSFFGLNFTTIFQDNVISDLNLRLAINHAINREEIADKLFFGQATPIYNFWDPTDKTYDPSFKYKYDPEKVRALLKKSSYKPGTALTINFHALLPNSEIVLQAVQNYLKQAGITTKLRQWEGGTLRGKYIKKSREIAEMGTNYWPGGDRDPNVRLTLGIKKGSFFSLYHSSPELDKMIDEQQFMTDAKERLVVLKKIYKMLFDDPAVCAFVSQNLIYATNDSIDYKWVPFNSQLFNVHNIKILK
ncbi:MAG: ABC transporter substrate-binding protein, partial [Deltaproteobacteria bacterium]|nr:ABC transporter substrate-binding protein [Deltaproteobacteria bacterium]